MRLHAIERLERDARRVAEVCGVAAKYGLADWLKGIHYGRLQEWLQTTDGQAIAGLSAAERFRLALTELGTTFIKLGQMLSTRPDVVGEEVALELGRLQSNVPADPPDVIRALIELELGKPLKELFPEFEAVAFASASVAQVHRARLPTGELVVVKVQRANIEKAIQGDLSILAGLAELAEEHVSALKIYGPVALVRQFQRTLLAELDFSHEGRNLDEFRRNFSADRMVHFPRPWPQYSSHRVLTMECLEGILGTDLGKLKAANVDLQAFARRGAELFLQMIFRDSFYHADPHPGNLMLLPGAVVGVLDCGMTGRLDEALRGDIENLVLAVAQKDPSGLTDAVWNLSVLPPVCLRDQLQADLADFVAEYTGPSMLELDLKGALRSLTDIIHRHHILLPARASLLLRTLVLLEGTAQELHPEFSLAELIEPFYSRAVGRKLSPKRFMLRLQRTYRDWDRLLQAFPGVLNDTLQRMRAGRFSVHLEHRHLDPIVNRLVLGILTASLFLGSSLLWSMKAPPLIFGVSIFGAAGYGMALILGWRLFRAIRKSGNLDSDSS
jgi:ubiquinone biosynthesis protein